MMLLTPIDQLPDRPSELIRGALSAIEECERDLRYQIDDQEGFWNRAWHQRKGNVCVVCMAGAVMAKMLYVPWGEEVRPESFDEGTQIKLMALNELRQGDIHRALIHVLGLESNPLQVERIITPYADDRKEFFRQMRKLADDLEEHGL